MLFAAPDLRRKKFFSFISSFFLQVLFLNLIYFFTFSLESSANAEKWLIFEDNDSRGGWLSGEMVLSIPDNKNFLSGSKFVMHWGNNPHQRLGMFLPIASIPIRKDVKKMKIQFKATRVPPGATHIILFYLDEKEKREELSSFPFFDKGVPESIPLGIIFEQTSKKGNSVKGRIILKRSWDERNLSHYAIYWGTGEKTVLRSKPPILVIKKRSWFGSLISQIKSPWAGKDLIEEIDVIMPKEATHLIAFSRNSQGQMNKGVSFKLEETNKNNNFKKTKLLLVKNPTPSGIISGEVSLIRNEKSDESDDYILFWGKDEKTRLSGLPPLTKFEIKKIQDGILEKEILVSSLTLMDQKLQVNSIKDGGLKLIYKFPKNTFVPKNAQYILAYKQQKFWFEDDLERKLKGPIASVSLEDPDGEKKKIEIKKKIKSSLKNFSIEKFKNNVSKNNNNEIDNKSFLEEKSEKQEKKIKSYDWRISEYRGIGFGLSLSGLNGLYAFYDYNIDGDTQLHFNLDLTGPQVSGVFKALRLTSESTNMESVGKSVSGNYLEINRTLFSTVYRWFVDESFVWGISEGFFYGVGAGFGYSTLNYKGRDSNAVATISGENETFSSTTTDYKHSTVGMGVFAILDTGWQGLRDYYFQISLQPSIYILYKDGYDENSIPVNPSQRSTVTNRWSRAKNPSRIIFGFGVFF